uniref:Uncharacterized protein n=1 Tax=Arundo donax TaxID=35708 RepID=A0A0A8YNV2_ARUDO
MPRLVIAEHVRQLIDRTDTTRAWELFSAW